VAPVITNSSKFEFLKDGLKDVIISINLNNIKIHFKVIFTKVSQINLYLFDSDIEENGDLRNITGMLYTGSRKLRLLQEIILGQGAIKLTTLIGKKIDILHINEGHAAFALLERINLICDDNKFDFEQALSFIKRSNFFTTHTPIIHGNEEFEIELLEKYLRNSDLLRYIGFEKFIELGSVPDNKKFSMTALSLQLCNKYNAVSRLHSVTAAKMWKILNKKIKFSSVTNGIYIKDWIAPEMADFLRRITNSERISIEKLLESKQQLKSKIVELLNQNYFFNKSESLLNLYKNTKIDPESIIIGFARRFAPYKRANLIFLDIERLFELIDKYKGKIIFIFSGKAHPADVDGNLIIKNLLNNIKDNHLEQNILFIENYDIKLAKIILYASDIWLNNPIRGLEACGTSGMKAALNAAINVSVLDGWWDEAYNGKNGWKIGNSDINKHSIKKQSAMVYDLLEKEILPLYFNNKTSWAEIMLDSIQTVVDNFGSDRMVADYNRIFYK